MIPKHLSNHAEEFTIPWLKLQLMSFYVSEDSV